MEEVQAVEETAVVKTMEDLKRDYTGLCSMAGDMQYKIMCLTEDLKNLNERIRMLNQEAAKMGNTERRKRSTMKVKSLKVKSMYLHQALNWPGHGADLTLNETKQKYKMHYVPSMHAIILEDKNGNQSCVPIQNCANYILADNVEFQSE
jgi:hypothetical protein